MSTALIVAGLAIVVIGVIVFLIPPPTPRADTRTLLEGVKAQTLDLGKVLEELNKLLEKFEKRYLPGLALMIVGLALVGMGVFLETKDAKDAAETAALLLLPL